MGDNRQVKAHGKGTIALEFQSGNKFMHDVLYVPGLAQDLSCLGQLIRAILLYLMMQNASFLRKGGW